MNEQALQLLSTTACLEYSQMEIFRLHPIDGVQTFRLSQQRPDLGKYCSFLNRLNMNGTLSEFFRLILNGLFVSNS